MTAVRIAVVGAGLIGRKHIAVLRSGIDTLALAAVVDPSPEADDEARRIGYPFFTDIDMMLDRIQPDGVVIAVPNQHHKDVSLACIQRRIPILVEKPIADSVGAALELVKASVQHSVPILVGHHRRHNAIMRNAAHIIREGGLGKLVAATSLWLGHKPTDYFETVWRREPGGGPILINAIHDIDCLRMLCGDVESVQAFSSNSIREFPVEDTAAAVLRFKNGALGTLIVSDVASSPWTWEWTSGENPFYPQESEDCYWISGTKGSLAIPSLVHRWHETGRESWAVPLRHESISHAKEDPLVEQMLHFSRVIQGLETPVIDGMDGTRTLATTLAIHESAVNGRLVSVEDWIQQNANAS